MTREKQRALVAWIIWFAILQAAFIYPFLLGGGFPKGDNSPEAVHPALWALCIGPVLLATALRWLILPRVQTDSQQQLSMMIVGLALSEGPILFSIFLLPEHPQYRIAVWMLAIVSVIQFAPSYATPGFKIEKT
ncbi:hypothetical protein [Coraliomargarita parva]|uniref:hypothetical protein n=1 Tax=Coraliomargarita parva TaxID=3014050 RepID=UPI0022B2D81D|nr:hypothetical protein [Coraliomargarita parva]